MSQALWESLGADIDDNSGGGTSTSDFSFDSASIARHGTSLHAASAPFVTLSATHDFSSAHSFDPHASSRDFATTSVSSRLGSTGPQARSTAMPTNIPMSRTGGGGGVGGGAGGGGYRAAAPAPLPPSGPPGVPAHMVPKAPDRVGPKPPPGMRYVPPPPAHTISSPSVMSTVSISSNAPVKSTKGSRYTAASLPGIAPSPLPRATTVAGTAVDNSYTDARILAEAGAPRIVPADSTETLAFATDAGAVAPDMWACLSCSFHNSDFLPSCEVCNAVRPAIMPDELPNAESLYRGALPNDPIARAAFEGKAGEAAIKAERAERARLAEVFRQQTATLVAEEAKRIATIKADADRARTAAVREAATSAFVAAKRASAAAAQAEAVKAQEEVDAARIAQEAEVASQANEAAAAKARAKKATPFGAKRSGVFTEAAVASATAASLQALIEAAEAAAKRARVLAADADAAANASVTTPEVEPSVTSASSLPVVQPSTTTTSTAKRSKAEKSKGKSADSVASVRAAAIEKALAAGDVAPRAWACSACLFHNSEYLNECEMCGLPRPSDSVFGSYDEPPTDDAQYAAGIAQEEHDKEVLEAKAAKSSKVKAAKEAAPAVKVVPVAVPVAPKVKKEKAPKPPSVPKVAVKPWVCPQSGCGRINSDGGEICWNCKKSKDYVAPVKVKAPEVVVEEDSEEEEKPSVPAPKPVPDPREAERARAARTQKAAATAAAAPAGSAKASDFSSFSSPRGAALIQDGSPGRPLHKGAWVEFELPGTRAIVAGRLMNKRSGGGAIKGVLCLAGLPKDENDDELDDDESDQNTWRLAAGTGNVLEIFPAAPEKARPPPGVRRAWLINAVEKSESGHRYFPSPKTLNAFLEREVLVECTDGLLRAGIVKAIDDGAANGAPAAIQLKYVSNWKGPGRCECGQSNCPNDVPKALDESQDSPYFSLRVPMSVFSRGQWLSDRGVVVPRPLSPSPSALITAAMSPPSTLLLPVGAWVATPMIDRAAAGGTGGGIESLYIVRVAHYDTVLGLYQVAYGNRAAWSPLDRALLLAPRRKVGDDAREAALSRLKRFYDEQDDDDDYSGELAWRHEAAYPKDTVAPAASELVVALPVGRVTDGSVGVGGLLIVDSRKGQWDIARVENRDCSGGISIKALASDAGKLPLRITCLGITPEAICAYAATRSVIPGAPTQPREATAAGRKPPLDTPQAGVLPIGTWVAASVSPDVVFVGRITSRETPMLFGSVTLTLTAPSALGEGPSIATVPESAIHELSTCAAASKLARVHSLVPANAVERDRLIGNTTGALPEDWSKPIYWKCGRQSPQSPMWKDLPVGTPIVAWRPSRTDWSIARVAGDKVSITWDASSAVDRGIVAAGGDAQEPRSEAVFNPSHNLSSPL